ncbi:hypothetical protein [Deinococcus sp. Leaf326]|uniref:hypothetical protein n=1 Tax=Deinococcus sp. Leaf326 TaxID=1736338 RepID=UPI0006F5C4BF|nr:hypothetical protein [Deinococcus sp. Leaf326]KQR22858.1 hypothetical protein ASF71_06745 [Deinococcus sp. Leaf326]
MKNLNDPLVLITWIFGLMNLIVIARYAITGETHMGIIGFLGTTFGALFLTIRARDARRKVEEDLAKEAPAHEQP